MKFLEIQLHYIFQSKFNLTTKRPNTQFWTVPSPKYTKCLFSKSSERSWKDRNSLLTILLEPSSLLTYLILPFPSLHTYLSTYTHYTRLPTLSILTSFPVILWILVTILNTTYLIRFSPFTYLPYPINLPVYFLTLPYLMDC